MTTRKDGESIEMAATMAPSIESDATMMPEIGSQSGVSVRRGVGVAGLEDDSPRYEKASVLGEGGMGQVWLVKDARIGRRVAMKQIRSQGQSGTLGLRDRFLREARVQGQLEHPAIVPVYDVGIGGDGEMFFTMKRVVGTTIADVIAAQRAGDAAMLERFSLRRLLTAFSQVCLAVDFAHERGVVHRDLKPDNLMLGDHGEVYVLDWGVARVQRDDLDAEAHAEDRRAVADMQSGPMAVHQTGLVGTPGYIAPELLRGEKVGPSVDVFALGAILFELIAREPLLGHGSSMERMDRALQTVDVASLIAKLDREVPPELVSLCVHATAIAPTDRIASARALQQAVEDYLDGERDQTLRLQLAERHLAESRAAMQLSGGDVEAHKRALRETGRALALVPDHPEARSIILSLFASTPTVVPPEVDDSIEVERAAQARTTAKGGAIGMASTLLFVPVLVLFGIRSWLGIAVFSFMCAAAAAISALAASRERRSDSLLYLVVVFNNLVFSLASGLYGPMVMVPAMVITNTISFALHLDGRTRALAIASGCLAILAPVALPLVGVVPSAYLPSGEGLLLRPLWVELPPRATLVFLTIGTLIAVVNGARAVSEVRDALTSAERKLQLQRWQLQQLLPNDRPNER